MQEATQIAVEEKVEVLINNVNVADCIYRRKLERQEDFCTLRQKNCSTILDCHFKAAQREKNRNNLFYATLCLSNHSKCIKGLKEVLELAKRADVLPCMKKNCTKCQDETSKKGTRCMKHNLDKIIEICKTLFKPTKRI